MKRIWIVASAALLCLRLAGCGGEPAPAPAPPDLEAETPQAPAVEDKPEAANEPDITEEPDETDETDEAVEPLPDSALTEDEIDYFNTEFFNQFETTRLRNLMLRSEYASAADVDLFQLFYGGASQTPEMASVTEEERALLAETDSMALTLDITKVTEEEMDAALLELTGLTLGETSRTGLEQFIYLGDYDAYYFAHGDTNYAFCAIESGTRNADGSVTLYYTHDYGGGAVTLRPDGDGYVFVSNTGSAGETLAGAPALSIDAEQITSIYLRW